MSDMSIKNIFDLFDHNKDENSGEVLPPVIEMASFEKTPTYKIGMFKNSDDEFETDDLEIMSEYLAYNRGWSYIRDCDIDSELWQGSLSIQHDDFLITSLKLSISYFEDAEEYEKCAFLVKIQKYLKSSLESQS